MCQFTHKQFMMKIHSNNLYLCLIFFVFQIIKDYTLLNTFCLTFFHSQFNANIGTHPNAVGNGPTFY